MAAVLLLAGCREGPAASRTDEARRGTLAAAASRPTPSSIDRVEIRASRKWRIAFAASEGFGTANERFTPYWQPGWEGMQRAALDFGVEIVPLPNARLCLRENAGVDCVETQIRGIARLVEAHGVDAIIVVAMDSNRLVPVLERAVRAGIPVLGLETPVSTDQVLTQITADQFELGRAIAEWVVGALRGAGKVLLLEGPRDDQLARRRREGILAGLKKGDIEVLDSHDADFRRAYAKTVTAAWLRQFPRIDAIVAANDSMAWGVSEAVREANRLGILVTGCNITQSRTLDMIRDGRISASVAAEPLRSQGRLAVQLLVRHLEKGERFPPIVALTGTTLVTSENVAQYARAAYGVAGPRSSR